MLVGYGHIWPGWRQGTKSDNDTTAAAAAAAAALGRGSVGSGDSGSFADSYCEEDEEEQQEEEQKCRDSFKVLAAEKLQERNAQLRVQPHRHQQRTPAPSDKLPKTKQATFACCWSGHQGVAGACFTTSYSSQHASGSSRM